MPGLSTVCHAPTSLWRALSRCPYLPQPKIALPSSVVSYVVRAGLPANIQAVARRAEEVRLGASCVSLHAGVGMQRTMLCPHFLAQIAASKLRASGLAAWAGTEDDPPIPVQSPVTTPAWEQETAEERAAWAAAAAVEQAARRQRERVEGREEALPSKGPFWRLTGSTFPEAAPLTAEQQRQQQGASATSAQLEEQALRPLQQAQREAQKEEQQQRQPQREQRPDPQSLYLGVVSVPLPPAGNRSSVQPETQQELDQRQEMKQQLQMAYPAFGLRRATGSGSTLAVQGADAGGRAAPAGAAEVHLRRLDTFDMLHRRAVAAVTIDAPPEVRSPKWRGSTCCSTAASPANLPTCVLQAVWAVVTDYDRLAEFIPNLAVSQRIALPSTAPSNIIRVRQASAKLVVWRRAHGTGFLQWAARHSPTACGLCRLGTSA